MYNISMLYAWRPDGDLPHSPAYMYYTSGLKYCNIYIYIYSAIFEPQLIVVDCCRRAT